MEVTSEPSKSAAGAPPRRARPSAESKPAPSQAPAGPRDSFVQSGADPHADQAARLRAMAQQRPQRMIMAPAVLQRGQGWREQQNDRRELAKYNASQTPPRPVHIFSRGQFELDTRNGVLGARG